jgi:glyoxylase-like metal-dependent hydrolase (beta-lactamase superfamily II)
LSIHALAVPTPFAVGRVNCYLVEDDPLTLVDCGPNSGTSLTRLEAGLAEYGRRVEDLERIVITHQHIDHIGLAQILADRSGAEVCALDALAPWLASYGEHMEADDRFSEAVMHRHGIPDDVSLALRAVTQQFRGWGASVQVGTPLRDGGELGFARRTWTVHHRPGHSPSDTVFHDAASGELVGGDHLIGHISSNPLISRPLDGGEGRERPKALVTYLASLRATRAMDLRVVYAGHGEPVTGHRELIDERLRMHDRRARKLAGLIAERPSTAHELAHELWGNVAVTQAYLTLSEILGHVDLLLDAGEVVEVEDDGVVRFTTA